MLGLFLLAPEKARKVVEAPNRADDRWFVLIVCLFAAYVRLRAIQHAAADLDPVHLDGPDSGDYFRTAASTSKDFGQIYAPLFWEKPGYPLFLALLFRLSGPSLAVAWGAQLILGTLSVALTFLLGKRLFSRSVGKLAAFLQAGNGYVIAFGSYIGTEALGLVLIQLSALALIRPEGTTTPGRGRGVLAGFALGATTLVRPEFLLFFPIALIWVLATWHPRVQAAAFLAVAFAAILTPWTVRNHAVRGKWVPFDLPAAQSLFLQQHPKMAKIGVGLNNPKELLGTLARKPLKTLTALFYSPEAPSNIRAFWDYRRYEADDFVHLLKGSLFSRILYIWEYALLVVGVVLGVSWRRSALLLIVFIAYRCLFAAWTYFLSWHRFTIEAFVIIFHAVAIFWLLEGAFKFRFIGGQLGKGTIQSELSG
ncbi:MAG: glycosyltransferase family 39 protein [Nitrospinota bacterium]